MDPIAFYDEAWHAMTKAAHRQFGSSCVINCMAFGHHCITGQILPSLDDHVFRNSDDTFPKVPESHVWHIYHNAMIACLTGAIANLIPDADMITTYMPAQEGEDYQWADFQAAFRACFSISTIWISDSADLETKRGNEILDRLLAPTKDANVPSTLGRLQSVQVGTRGSNRCSRPLIRSIFETLTADNVGPALKMSHDWSTNNDTITSAILSTWSVRLAATSVDWITIADVAHSVKAGSNNVTDFFLVNYSSSSACLVSAQATMSSLSALTELPLLPLALKPSQYQIYSITSALAIDGRKDVRLAYIGLVDKYAGLTAVVSSSITKTNVVISSALSRAGRCAFVIHGVKRSALKKWHAHIDGVKVHNDHYTIEQIDDCSLCIVDMVPHLQMNLKTADSDTHWHVDLIEGDRFE